MNIFCGILWHKHLNNRQMFGPLGLGGEILSFHGMLGEIEGRNTAHGLPRKYTGIIYKDPLTNFTSKTFITLPPAMAMAMAMARIVSTVQVPCSGMELSGSGPMQSLGFVITTNTLFSLLIK